MTTKTDAAMECAYEQCAKSIWGRIATSFGQSPISWPPAWIEEELRQHFPPSVPVSDLHDYLSMLTAARLTVDSLPEDEYHRGMTAGYGSALHILKHVFGEALIAEAK